MTAGIPLKGASSSSCRRSDLAGQRQRPLDSHTAPPYYSGMEEALVFEWDEAKADANYRKHRVTFQLAARAFDDDHGLDLVDDRMDYGEERWLRIALVEGRVLSVAYTRRTGTVRIVSARASTRRERRMYHG
ncbi:MAG: BrnT family toxin [Chromatiales bacterium]|nr:BrnT family toxin [Chromatiales bacterium]